MDTTDEWEPTCYLRTLAIPGSASLASAIGTARLQQLWRNKKTGAEEWRGIPTVQEQR